MKRPFGIGLSSLVRTYRRSRGRARRVPGEKAHIEDIPEIKIPKDMLALAQLTVGPL
jgi:hypothetical protein